MSLVQYSNEHIRINTKLSMVLPAWSYEPEIVTNITMIGDLSDIWCLYW